MWNDILDREFDRQVGKETFRVRQAPQLWLHRAYQGQAHRRWSCICSRRPLFLGDPPRNTCRSPLALQHPCVCSICCVLDPAGAGWTGQLDSWARHGIPLSGGGCTATAAPAAAGAVATAGPVVAAVGAAAMATPTAAGTAATAAPAAVAMAAPAVVAMAVPAAVAMTAPAAATATPAAVCVAKSRCATSVAARLPPIIVFLLYQARRFLNVQTNLTHAACPFRWY